MGLQSCSQCLSDADEVCICRGTEVVEGVVRHHISACFAALESTAVSAVEDVGARISQGVAITALDGK